jgi:hypothetical protein
MPLFEFSKLERGHMANLLFIRLPNLCILPYPSVQVDGVSLCAAAINPRLDRATLKNRPSRAIQFDRTVVAKFRWRGWIAASCSGAMTNYNEAELRAQLERLRQEHRDLDAAISALQDAPGSDVLQVQRLKKRKLWLRDRIAFIEDELTPDIIA